MRNMNLIENWVECKLGEILIHSKEKHKPLEIEKLFYVGLEHIEKNTAQLTDSVRIAEVKTVKNKFYSGEILYGKLRPYFNKVYLAKRSGVCSTDILVFKATDFVVPKFALHLMTSRKFVNKMSSNMSGVNLPRVSTKIVKSYPFPLPPLPIQRTIVAKIETLFSSLDSGIADLEKAQAQLKIYRQAVLKQAFEGELTKEWRAQQTDLPTAEELLEEIRAARERYYETQLAEWKTAVQEWENGGKEGKKPRKPRKLKDYNLSSNDVENLPRIPKSWKWCKTGGICLKIQIGPFGTQLHKHDYKPEGVPVINPKHIKNQRLFPNIYISEEKAKSLNQYYLRQNDIILGRRGEMGRSAPISHIEKDWFCGTGSLFIRLGNKFLSKLYSMIIAERRTIRYLEDKGSGTTMTNLNAQIVNNLPLPIIPLQEQHQIVREIESRLSVCEELEKSIAASLEKAQALRQSILKQAFAGALLSAEEVAQCRQAADYEPAEVLLERIKAEKTKKQKK